MSWYKIVKPFQMDLKLVVIVLCGINDDLLGVDYFSNDIMLNGISKYLLFFILKQYDWYF